MTSIGVAVPQEIAPVKRETNSYEGLAGQGVEGPWLPVDFWEDLRVRT